MMSRLATALLTMCLAAPALAGGVFKCVDGDGHVTFSFVSCPAAPAPDAVAPELSLDEQRADARARLREIQRELDHAHSSIRNYQKAQDSALLQLETDASANADTSLETTRRDLRARYRELIGEQLDRIDELRRERKEYAASANPHRVHS